MKNSLELASFLGCFSNPLSQYPPKKIKLQPLNKVFSFLGAFIKPNNTGKFKARAGRRIISNFKNCILHPSENPKLQHAKVQSYLGLFGSLR